jgi:hypothetical protein
LFPKLNLNDLTNFKTNADAALILATKIESSLKTLTCKEDDEISKEYTRKFRDLLVGLKNDKNRELRLNLVTGEILPSDFAQF